MKANCVIFLLLFLTASGDQAQTVPRSGTHFTFGIPEGADAISPLEQGQSTLLLTVVSLYDGNGIITSPAGYCQEFSFVHDSATIITLPYNLMHVQDIGKTNKGILVRTSQPVNLVFHDFLFDAGEATQIYPDEALDTSYHITTWGIANDPPFNYGLEDNHSQFLITASEDNTIVTITPSVNILGGIRAGIPFVVHLNRGECYIVKADATAQPSDLSLTHSQVRATKPVSIISAVTCGYVPLENQSCQELLDEILPRKITDTVFFIAPLRDQNQTSTILFTSDTSNFFVITTSGTTYLTTNGWLTLTVSDPEIYTVSAPAYCYVFSEGSEVQDFVGDPTMTTVLPQSQWRDTLLWFTPNFNTSGGPPFDHFISIVYPQSSENNILLDGSPIASVSSPQQIFSSIMSGTTALITPGVHLLTSPVPVFGIATGFNPENLGSFSADGYSFLPGTVAPKLPIDTLPAFLSISNTPAGTCRSFTADILTAFHSIDGITSGTLTITYDPNILKLLSATLGSSAQGGQWTVNTVNPGTIIISASCLTAFNDSDIFVTLGFTAGPAITTTTITASISEMGGETVFGAHAARTKKDISILRASDTAQASFTISADTVVFGSYANAAIHLATALADSVKEIDFFISYNHDLDSLLFADVRSTFLSSFITTPTILPIRIDNSTDEIVMKFSPPILLPPPGIIAKLLFQTYVTDSLRGAVTLRTSMEASRSCPLDITSDGVTMEFVGVDTCGTGPIRSLLLNQPIMITSIAPNPSNGAFTVNLERHIFAGDPVHLELYDILGNKVWNMDYLSSAIHEEIGCRLPHSVTGGYYFLRVSISGKTQSQKIVIQK